METAQPYGIGAYFAYRHDPLTGMPDAEAIERALDKLKLLVSIDVRYSETGWYSDVILPESTYLERANILAGLPGPVPVVLHARPGDRAALRQPPGLVDLPRDPAPHGHQGGARLRDHRGALELPARGHGRHRRRDARGGVRPPGRRAEADAARQAQVPDPLGQDRDRERGPEEGRAAQPAALRAEGGAHGRPLQPAVRDARRRWRTASPSTTRSCARSRRNRCSGSTPTAPGRWGSATGTRSRSAGADATAEGSRPR